MAHLPLSWNTAKAMGLTLPPLPGTSSSQALIITSSYLTSEVFSSASKTLNQSPVFLFFSLPFSTSPFLPWYENVLWVSSHTHTPPPPPTLKAAFGHAFSPAKPGIHEELVKTFLYKLPYFASLVLYPFRVPAPSQVLASLPLSLRACCSPRAARAHWAAASADSPLPSDGLSLRLSSPASPDRHSSPRTSYPVSRTSLLLAGDLEARWSSNDPFPIPNPSSPPASRPHTHLPIVAPSSSVPLPHFQRKVLLPVPNLTLLHRLFPVSCICNLLSTSSFLGAYKVT